MRKLVVACLALISVLWPAWETFAAETQWSPPAGAKIRIVSYQSPGVGGDVASRYIAKRLAERFGNGVSVVIENHTGSAGLAATLECKRAINDGTTICFWGNPPAATWPATWRINGEEPLYNIEDFGFICRALWSVFLVAVNKDIGNDFASLFKQARTDEGLTIGIVSGSTTGTAAVNDIKAALPPDIPKDKVIAVPYKTMSEGVAIDVMGKHVSAGIAASFSILQRADFLNIIATYSEHRAPFAPNVPTFPELGIKMSQRWPAWSGFFAPPGTDQKILERYEKEIKEILAEPDIIKKLIEVHNPPNFVDGKTFRELVRQESAETTYPLRPKQ